MSVAGCALDPGTPAHAYRDWRDRVQAVTGLPLAGWGPCGRAIWDPDYVPEKSLTEICYRLTEQRRWKGLWRNEFEGSLFCPGAPATCSSAERSRVWLDRPDRRPPDGQVFRIEFIGRRTQHAGSHGHMGQYKHEMIVDRLISIEQVPVAGSTR